MLRQRVLAALKKRTSARKRYFSCKKVRRSEVANTNNVQRLPEKMHEQSWSHCEDPNQPKENWGSSPGRRQGFQHSKLFELYYMAAVSLSVRKAAKPRGMHWDSQGQTGIGHRSNTALKSQFVCTSSIVQIVGCVSCQPPSDTASSISTRLSRHN